MLVSRSARSMATAAAARTIRGVIFDMDGTLTRQGAIDFKLMRARAGIPAGEDILAHIASQPEPERTRKMEVVVEEETLGLDRMSLMDDCGRVFRYLMGQGLPRALLTRNNDQAMHKTVALLRTAIREHMRADGARHEATEGAIQGQGSSSSNELFTHMLSRTFTPAKPHPAPILHLCSQWGIQPHDCVMVGDSLDDIACAKAAGAYGVLIGADETCQYYREALPHADATIRSLGELINIIERLDGRGSVTVDTDAT